MIIGVTGSRTWTDRKVIADAFDEITPPDKAFHSKLLIRELVMVLNGFAPGADRLCDLETMSRGWQPVRVPANWNSHGKAAGLLRNGAMIELAGSRAVAWLAFISQCTKPGCAGREPHGTHGTADCVKQAEAAGIEVRRYGWKS